MQSFLELLHSEPMLAVLGAVVALATAWVTWFGVKSQERARQQQYLSQLRIWADACVEDMSEALHLCLLDPAVTTNPSFFNRRHALLVKLSARVDQGRWFFPNVDTPGIGDWKGEAFRGFKQRPLMALIYCYNAVKEMSYKDKQLNTQHWEFLAETKRAFTSDIQSMLDPRKTYKEFKLRLIHED